MALSKRSKDILIVSMADRRSAQEITAAIDALVAATPAGAVAVLGVTSNLSAAVVAPTTIVDSNLTAVDAANPTKAEIDTGIDTLRDAIETALDLKSDNVDLNTLRSEIEDRLDDLEAKIDEVIDALVVAGLML